MRRHVRIAVATVMLLLATVLFAPPAGASHTWSVVEASAATKKGVVAAVNARLKSQRPAWCFRVWVAKSHPGWATYGWSKTATGESPCLAFDGLVTFYRKTSAGSWVYAGDGPGWEWTKCTFRVHPPPGVPLDFGCHWWRVTR